MILGRNRPGQLAKPVQVVYDAAVFWRGLRNPLHPLQFAIGFLPHALGHLGLGDGVAKLLGLGFASVTLAQLLADRVELLVEVVLPLVLVDPAANLLVDLSRQLEHFELVGEGFVDLPQPQRDVEGLQQFLLLHQVEGQVGRQEIDQTTGAFDVVEDRDRLFRDAGRQGNDLLRLGLGRGDEGLQLGRAGDDVLPRMRAGDEIRLGLDEILDPEARQAMNNDGLVAFGEVQQLQHRHHGADPIQIVERGILRLGRPLGHDAKHFGSCDHLADELLRLLPPDGQRNDGPRKYHGIPHR